MVLPRATTRHAFRHGACLLLLAALPALAFAAPLQSGTSRDVPIPAKKPPPPGKDSTAPTVTIRSADNGDVVEEYRQGGKVFMVRVTPKHGKPYYLYDDDRNGRLDRTDADKASVSPVYWTIYEWD